MAYFFEFTNKASGKRSPNRSYATASVFRPSVDNRHKYAVALPVGGGRVVPIQSYETLEQLREGYQYWQRYASDKKFTGTFPIEFLDKSGKCRVLTDIIQARE